MEKEEPIIRETTNKPSMADTSIRGKIAKVLLGEETILEVPKEPVLELMRNDGRVDIIQGVQPGEFIIKDGDRTKSILLTPEKLFAKPYGEKFIKTWYAHEDIAMALPQDPLYFADQINRIFQKMRLNWQARDESKILSAKGGMYMKIAIGLGLLIVMLSSTGLLDTIINAVAPAAAPAAKAAVDAVATSTPLPVATPGVVIT